jgi:hypothetical protein
MRARAIALFSICLLPFVLSAARGQEWNIQLVDDAGDVGYYSQIVALADGTPCIAYKAGATIRLARWVENGGNSGWVFRQMSTNVYGNNIKMIADDLYHLHFLYANGSTLYYGVFDVPSDSWLLGPQSTGLSSGSYNVDLTVYNDGTNRIPYVAVCINGNPVRVATRNPSTGAWSSELVTDDSHPGTGAPSIAVDSHGGLHVSFCEMVSSEYNLMYAVKAAGGSWLLQTVDPGGASVNVGEYSSILIDSSDGVHIAYYDRTNKDLKYATLVTP